MCSEIKEYLISLNETDTMFILRSLRNTARVIKNEVAEQVAAIEARGNATIEELIPLVSGANEKEVMDTGDISKGLLHCGQAIGLIHDYPSVKDIMQNILSEAERTKSRLHSLTS